MKKRGIVWESSSRHNFCSLVPELSGKPQWMNVRMKGLTPQGELTFIDRAGGWNGAVIPIPERRTCPPPTC